MLALNAEENNVRTAALKYTWLLIMRRIGVIMYDKFVLTGFPLYLMSLRHNQSSFGSLPLKELFIE